MVLILYLLLALPIIPTLLIVNGRKINLKPVITIDIILSVVTLNGSFKSVLLMKVLLESKAGTP